MGKRRGGGEGDERTRRRRRYAEKDENWHKRMCVCAKDSGKEKEEEGGEIEELA